MNILIDKLPQSLTVGGEEFEIDADFRSCLTVILAYEDEALTEQEKAFVLLSRIFKGDIPKENIKEALDKATWFINCGEEPGRGGERLYSFEQDAKYIYSAISQSHGIDLQGVDFLHWWQFCYLFLDLDKDCFFTQLIDLRRRKNEGKLIKEEAEFCSRISDILELGSAEEESSAAEFMEALRKGEPCG